MTDDSATADDTAHEESAEAPSLTELNRAVHAELDQLVFRLIEATTALDEEGYTRAFRELVTQLNDHAEIEETRVFPHCMELDVPRNGSVEIVERDHNLLDKSLGNVEQVLVKIADADPDEQRSILARNLFPFVRLQRVLEHHTERELDLLYPAADAQLPDDLRRKMATALAKKT